MDNMKTLMRDTGLLAKIRKRWNVESHEIVNDGSKYGGPNDSDRVHNPIVGFTTVGDLKDLERRGIVIYQEKAWRIPREQRMVNGKMAFPVSRAYLNYRLPASGSRELNRAERASLPDAVLQAEKILGGRVVRSFDERNITG